MPYPKNANTNSNKIEFVALKELLNSSEHNPAYREYEKRMLHSLFYMNIPDCEQGEVYSPACEILTDESLKQEDIEVLYKKLKRYEDYWDESHTIGEIVAREMIVAHPSTPIEIIEDISKTSLACKTRSVLCLKPHC